MEIPSALIIYNYYARDTTQRKARERGHRMKLYEAPRGSKIRVLGDIDEGNVLYFDHLDGMYSYCIDSEGNIVHLSASAEVEVIK